MADCLRGYRQVIPRWRQLHPAVHNRCMTETIHKIPVGISSCLIGEQVRFDGGHKLDRYINSRLADFMEFRPFCPEVAIGLGIPRAPIRLVSTTHGIRVRGVKDPDLDVTERLSEYGRRIAQRMDDLCGYIFKSRSPSCGMERVKTYGEDGLPGRSEGVGAYAREIMHAHPDLPVEEEGRLNDPGLRDNFIERVFTWYRWQQLLAQGITPARLVQFHSRQKLSVMAHNQAAYRRLGQLVATAGSKDFGALCKRYEHELMQAMQRLATRKSHTNTLQHLQGYFSKQLCADDRAELCAAIDDYRLGLVPLAVPLTLIRHHFRHHPNEWALQQTYLEPYPRELMHS
jgi:uncharacterized protein YbgA (DUF1722 family)/uncharacterized protein YbbK (DUF523 family)